MAEKKRTRTGNQRTKKNVGKRQQDVGQREGLLYENRYEIGFVLMSTLSLLLFLSNFGIIGAVGRFVKGVEFGLFGFMAWFMPFYLFFTTLFILANKGNKRVKVKNRIMFGILLVLSAISELISNGNVAGKDWGRFYSEAAKYENGGGFFGGIIAKFFTSGIALVGSYIVLIALLIILIIILTGKLFTGSINRRMAETRDHFLEYKEERMEVARKRAEEKSDRRREVRLEKREERERIRNEKLLSMRLEEERLRKQKKEEADRAEYERIVREEKEKEEKEKREEKTFSERKIETELREIGSEEKSDLSSLIHEAMKKVTLKAEEEGYYKELLENKFGETAENSSEGKEDPMREADLEEKSYAGLSWDLISKNEDEMEVELEEESEEEVEEKSDESEIQEVEKEVEEEVEEKEEKVEEENELIEYEALMEGEEEEITNFLLGEEDLEEEENSDSIDVENIPQKSDLEIEKEEILGKKEVVRDSKPISSFGGNQEEKKQKEEEKADEKEVKQIKPYVFPSLSLLEKADKEEEGVSAAELHETADKLQKTLEAFGVKAKITDVSCGPSVTRYELQPEIGVKVSRITSLADDIKLNLAAADIRIEAPIPGKAAVGIEVPNKKNSMVYFRDLIENKGFVENASKLSFAVGKDIGGQTMVTDIAKMPHLLIAGATGSGKSVCINTLIMSVLYKAKPDEVKFIMIDPKVVELSCYNGIPHLLLPVVTDPKKAAAALNWAVAEMNRRYTLFAEKGVRNIKGFNKTVGKESDEWLPQLVIIVDELADLMMVSSKDVEEAICRLAQLARAAGIHLVIATQRPSVNVITGLIKANIPSRIAFAVSSQVDSRTILDGAGAEKLLGKGDMLFFPSGYPKPVRVQGAFVSDDEVSGVVDFIRSNNGEEHISTDITEEVNAVISSEAAKDSGERKQGEEVEDEYDEYFDEAGKLVIQRKKASIGMLQRVYRIGFNRAARLMDQLAEAGVVSEEDGTRPRKVVMEMEEFVKFLAIRHGEDMDMAQDPEEE